MPQLLPHGWYSLLPPVLATCGWVSSLFQDGCDYVLLQGSIVKSLANSDAPFLEGGFDAYREPRYNPSSKSWELEYTGTCLEYPSEPVDITADNYWQAAKFFDFAAVVLGGAGAFFLWCSTACVFSPGTWRWTGYEIFFAALFQGLAFLWLRNDLCYQPEDDTQCSFSWGAKMDVVAGSLWLLAALLIFAHYPQVVDDDWIEDDDDDELYEDEPGDDGPFEEIDLPLPTSPELHHIPTPSHVMSISSSQLSGEDSHEGGRGSPTPAKIV